MNPNKHNSMELGRTTFYLAGPLNHETELGYEWRNRVAKRIREVNGRIKDPKQFEPGVDASPEECVRIDKSQIIQSDAIIVNFLDAHENLSIGTPMEMMFAYTFDKMIIVIGAEDHNWVQTHADQVYSSVDEFIDEFINLPNEILKE